MYEVMYLFIIFIFYSFVGYVLETVYTSLLYRRFNNRGFLFGPVIPIYGVGVSLFVTLLSRYQENLFIVFILGIVISTILENTTGLVLERIFHNKWWDYSNRIDNINGRLCGGNLLIFGLGAVLVVCFLHPKLDSWIINFNDYLVIFGGLFLLIIFVLDIIYSFKIAYELRKEIIIVEELKNRKIKSLPEMIEKVLGERITNLKSTPLRLFKSFPNLSKFNTGKLVNNFIEQINEERKKLDMKIKEIKNKRVDK